jgi:hypothetical protein
MRTLAIVFFAFALIFAVDAVRDQYRGIAMAFAPRMPLSASSLSAARILHAASASEATDPEGFRGLMAYQWIRVVLCIAAGYIFWHFYKRSRALDPFSPDAP